MQALLDDFDYSDDEDDSTDKKMSNSEEGLGLQPTNQNPPPPPQDLDPPPTVYVAMLVCPHQSNPFIRGMSRIAYRIPTTHVCTIIVT